MRLKKTSRRNFLRTTGMAGPLIATSVIAQSTSNSKASERMNVIIINIDNHNKASLGYYGNKFIETPNIDQIFKEGIRFENYQCAGRCTASRSALLTGRYHARNGALGTGDSWGYTREGVTTMAHVFSRAGYRTAMFGKWHLGGTYPLWPENRGFDETVMIENGGTLAHVMVEPGYNDSYRTGTAFRCRHNGKWEVYKGFRTDIWFNELNKYLTKNKNSKNPFFVYIATVTAHGPHFGPEDLRDKYMKKMQSPEWNSLQEKAASDKGKEHIPYDHAADIGNLDRNVGSLLKTLKSLKLMEKTLVIYTSDGAGGGPASIDKKELPEDAQASGIPMVFRYPDPASNVKRSYSELIANIDVLPTLADICGVSLNSDLKADIDGQSFASLIGIPDTKFNHSRIYISDHQSRSGKEDIPQRYMLFRPMCSATVYLPKGRIVQWKSNQQKLKNATEQDAKEAKTAYDKWVRRVIKDFPLGAFSLLDTIGRTVFLDAYPIMDGLVGPGLKAYFLMDVASDGQYEISTDKSGRYGEPINNQAKNQSLYLTISWKKKPGKMNAGFDKKMNGYRVLPETLEEYFETSNTKLTFPANIKLKKGRYLLSLNSNTGPLPKNVKKLSENKHGTILNIKITRKS